MDNLSEVLDRIATITGVKPEFYKVDVCNKDEMRKIFESESISAVIHFAGYKAVGESVAKPLMYYNNNLNVKRDRMNLSFFMLKGNFFYEM